MRTITAAERRARRARRQALEVPAADVVAAAWSVVCFHATDPATVVLSARARVATLASADYERELDETRSLVRHLAMRRTLFVFPRELLPAARDVEHADLRPDGERWLAEAGAARARRARRRRGRPRRAPGRGRGETAGSSAAGGRTSWARSRSGSSRTSARKAGAHSRRRRSG